MLDAASAVAEIRALRAEIAETRQELQLVLRRMLSKEDRRDLAELLPLAHQVMGAAAWSAAELYAAALGSSDLQGLMDGWKTETGGLRAFGNFLERCRGITVSGLQLVDVGKSDTGLLYLARVSSPPKL